MDLNYEKDLEIDLDDLHTAWVKQDILMMRYGREAAKAKEAMQLAHEKVKLVRSDLIKKKKAANPSATGQQIEAYYRLHKRHRKAKKTLINAEYENDLLQAAVTALHHKKSALENLVKLHGQQYFSKPEIKNTITEESIRKSKSRSAKNKIKQRRRTR